MFDLHALLETDNLLVPAFHELGEPGADRGGFLDLPLAESPALKHALLQFLEFQIIVVDLVDHGGENPLWLATLCVQIAFCWQPQWRHIPGKEAKPSSSAQSRASAVASLRAPKRAGTNYVLPAPSG